MHGDLRRRNDSVVGVGHEARVHAIGNSVAGSIEGRLGDGVVLREELEDDGVTDGDVVKLVGLEDQTTGTTDCNSVARASSRDSGGLVLHDGGGDTIVHGDLSGVSTSGDGLGDSDLLVDDGRRGIATRVCPDQVSRRLLVLRLLLRQLLLLLLLLGGLSLLLGDLGDRVLHDRSSNGVLLDGSSGSRVHGHRLRLDEVTVASDATAHGEWRKGQDNGAGELHFGGCCRCWIIKKVGESDWVLSKAVLCLFLQKD